jgi:hypothetical protein
MERTGLKSIVMTMRYEPEELELPIDWKTMFRNCVIDQYPEPQIQSIVFDNTTPSQGFAVWVVYQNEYNAQKALPQTMTFTPCTGLPTLLPTTTPEIMNLIKIPILPITIDFKMRVSTTVTFLTPEFIAGVEQAVTEVFNNNTAKIISFTPVATVARRLLATKV